MIQKFLIKIVACDIVQIRLEKNDFIIVLEKSLVTAASSKK